jgi:hypothetical protein
LPDPLLFPFAPFRAPRPSGRPAPVVIPAGPDVGTSEAEALGRRGNYGTAVGGQVYRDRDMLARNDLGDPSVGLADRAELLHQQGWSRAALLGLNPAEMAWLMDMSAIRQRTRQMTDEDERAAAPAIARESVEGLTDDVLARLADARRQQKGLPPRPVFLDPAEAVAERDIGKTARPLPAVQQFSGADPWLWRNQDINPQNHLPPQTVTRFGRGAELAQAQGPEDLAPILTRRGPGYMWDRWQGVMQALKYGRPRPGMVSPLDMIPDDRQGGHLGQPLVDAQGRERPAPQFPVY